MSEKGPKSAVLTMRQLLPVYPLTQPFSDRQIGCADVCGACGRLLLKDLPDWDWDQISAHLRCTECGTVGYVDTRPNWSEVINFDKGVC